MGRDATSGGGVGASTDQQPQLGADVTDDGEGLGDQLGVGDQAALEPPGRRMPAQWLSRAASATWSPTTAAGSGSASTVTARPGASMPRSSPRWPANIR